MLLNEALNYVLIRLRMSDNHIKTNGIIFLLILQSSLIVYTLIFFNVAKADNYYSDYAAIQTLFIFAYIFR